MDVGTGGAYLNVPSVLRSVAKEHSDHLRQKTGNKIWTGKWTRRVADVIASFRKQLDGSSNTATLSKLFLVEWDTPLPKGQGVCFADVYLDDKWDVASKGPEKNCYLKVDYPYFYENTLADYPERFA